MADFDQVVRKLQEFKEKVDSEKWDADACAKLLSELKIALIELDLLNPEAVLSGGLTDDARKKLLLARETLEYATLLSVKQKDLAGFERHVAQVKVYYQDATEALVKSDREFIVLGLNLLFLLSQNRIAEFHTELEVISQEGLSNYYIKHPIELEQHVMEGSYNKVMKAREDVPSQTYSFFMELLMDTVRDEVASCIEESFQTVKRDDARVLLGLNEGSESVFEEFVEGRGWKLEDGLYRFARDVQDDHASAIPAVAQNLIERTLHYASELERIV